MSRKPKTMEAAVKGGAEVKPDHAAMVHELKAIFSYGRGAWSRLATLAEQAGSKREWEAIIRDAGGADGTGYAQYCSRLSTALEYGVKFRDEAGKLLSYDQLGGKNRSAKDKAAKAGASVSNAGRKAGGTNTGQAEKLLAERPTFKEGTDGKLKAVKPDGTERGGTVAQALEMYYKAAIAVLIATGASIKEIAAFVRVDSDSIGTRFSKFRVELLTAEAKPESDEKPQGEEMAKAA